MSHAQQLHDRRYLDDYLQMIHRIGLPSNVTAEVCQQVHQAVLSTVQRTIEQALEEELTPYLGGDRYEHVSQGRPPEQPRSGFYHRTLLTQYALLSDLKVPKLRRGNRQRPWQVLERYERCWGPLLDHQILGYCLGLSLRDLQETMRMTLGEVLSLEAWHRILHSLQGHVQTCKETRLTDPPPVVIVDGIWVKSASPTGEITVDVQGRRRAAKRQHKRVVLTARGVWPDGHWELLHWQIAPTESAAHWTAFFKERYTKGVTPETTHLVGSAGGGGIERAIELYLSGVPHQRCLFHKIKTLADHLPLLDLALDPTLPRGEAERQAKRERKQAILAHAAHIYTTAVEAEIRERVAAFCTTWETKEPQAVANFLAEFDNTLSSLTVDLPRSLVSLIRTPNLLERFHREVRRKQRDMGMFHSEQGCEILFYLIAMRETAKQRAAAHIYRN